jgi:hypothetical protein
MLELQQFLGGFVDEVFDAVLVGEPVAAPTVSSKCKSKLSSGLITPAAPPSAAQVWLRMG